MSTRPSCSTASAGSSPRTNAIGFSVHGSWTLPPWYWNACGSTDFCEPIWIVMSTLPTWPGGVRTVACCGSVASAGATPSPMSTLSPGPKPLPVILIQSPPFWLPSLGVTPSTTNAHDAVSATQMLAQQVPPSHTVPHEPQFCGSLVVSTHALPHRRCAPLHAPPPSTVASPPPLDPPPSPAGNDDGFDELPHPPPPSASAPSATMLTGTSARTSPRRRGPGLRLGPSRSTCRTRILLMLRDSVTPARTCAARRPSRGRATTSGPWAAATSRVSVDTTSCVSSAKGEWGACCSRATPCSAARWPSRFCATIWP